MKVFKFGGASIKSAEAVRNMAEIVRQHQDTQLFIVVSAMGKTTNALELVLRLKDKTSRDRQIEEIRHYHLEIANNLFGSHPIYDKINQLTEAVRMLAEQELPYDELYDQVVSHGELISSQLIYAWLNETGIPAHLLDARTCIRTDSHFREGHVDWEITKKLLSENVSQVTERQVLITQGFIGGTASGKTTTLGREGSDFTAAILASCLGASSVTVWKDVDGIMNADPKRVPQTVKFDQIPYKEAAEMTYYGASVIHPKTIKPLANAQIPLYVRSFYHPEKEGTAICESVRYAPIPVVIMKDNQCLVSFHVRDFTFVNEHNLSLIFHELAEMDMKMNMMQNSAISFSICVDNDAEKLNELMERLKDTFEIRFNADLLLITVKNYTEEFVSRYRNTGTMLLEQSSRTTYRVLVDPELPEPN